LIYRYYEKALYDAGMAKTGTRHELLQVQRRYEASDKGKAARRRYEISDDRKAARRRYTASGKKKTANQRRVFAFSEYRGCVPTVEGANYLRQRLAEFRQQQQNETYEEFKSGQSASQSIESDPSGAASLEATLKDHRAISRERAV
jgi:hypothetical protein